MFKGEAARAMLGRMPSRLEEDLDAVTLHNQALFHVDQQPVSAALAKLHFLLRQQSFPAETFENLLLLYTKYDVRDRRAVFFLAPTNSFVRTASFENS